jgi:FkbM family methyltransferase
MGIRHKLPFVLAASDQGAMIVSRFDYRKETHDTAVGVGIEILEQGAYQPEEIDMALGLLILRRQYFGPGVLAIDGGANIGVHAVSWARAMHGWGQVIAIEPQERIFYALAGNICLSNLFNACAIQSAISDIDGAMDMPVPDYEVPGNYGGLTLSGKNDIGQKMDNVATVRTLKIDSLDLQRVDLIKLDIEGMETKALEGARETIEAERPILMIEHIKSDFDLLLRFAESYCYEAFRFGGNLVCAHRLDKTLDHIRHLHKTLLRGQMERNKFDLDKKEVA